MPIWDALIRAAILLGFMNLLGWLIRTQQLALYINPKFLLLGEIAYYVLLIMAIILVVNIVKPSSCHSKEVCCASFSRWTYVPFIIVLVLALLIPENTLNANFVANKEMNSQIPKAAPTKKAAPRPLAAEFGQTQLITITENNFIEGIRELTLYPQDYQGKEISITGFVYKGRVTGNNEFSLVRYIIVCCASDAMPYGLLCETDEADRYSEETWLSVRGVIKVGQYNNKDSLIVKISSIKQIEKPSKPYVY